MLYNVYVTAQNLQVADLPAASMLDLHGIRGHLGTTESEDDTSLRAVAKSPGTGAAREVEWIFEPPPCPPPPGASADIQPCPTLFSKELEAMPEGSSFDCSCAYDKYGKGSLWGTRVYYIGSDVCDAAQHAGMVERKESTVTVFLGGPCDRFWRSKSYGMESESRRKPGRSMAFQQPYPACPGLTGPW